MQELEYKIEYSSSPNIVLGFHGCDRDCVKKILAIDSKEHLKPSENLYDWLGHGVYFWEANPKRAMQWATETDKKKPYIVGAIISLGNCLNLLDSKCLLEVKRAYNKYLNLLGGRPPAKNENKKKYLDCAVINLACALKEEAHENNPDIPIYDTVRGVFFEGSQLFGETNDTDLREQNHIQICVRNPKAILGYFNPLQD
ncbi:MAG: hypothetical protein LBV16_06090 [Elusimicrobiota bacterium]|jgi:hypothetical protein|nr:hypothetical protein [Elusimicrobiota bacterium]